MARKELLERIERDDPTAAQEAHSLLDAWFSAPNFLDQAPLFEPPDRTTSRVSPPASESDDCAALDLRQLLRHWKRYRLEERLGSGSTSLVYRATPRHGGQAVAIKFLVHLGDREIARFQQEAETLLKVRHPGILELLETGSVEGVPFLVTRLVEGPGLLQLRSSTTLREKVEIILQVTRGLQAAHQRRVVHRDIKPSNILVENIEGTWIPYLADFGIARDPESLGLTATGMLVGTPAYLAPERLRKNGIPLDPRSDLYSLGVTFFEFLTGRRPYSAPNTLEVLFEIHQGKLLRPRDAMPTLPRDLETILLSCLALEPEDRYGSAEVLIADLERFLDDKPVTPRQTSWPSRSTGWKGLFSSRSRVLLSAAGLTLLTLAALWAIRDGGDLPTGAFPLILAKPDVSRPSSPRNSALGHSGHETDAPATPAGSELHAQGRARLKVLDFTKARVFLETALESSPGQPMLQAELSKAWMGLGFDDRARHHAESALAGASQLPETERLLIEGQVFHTRSEWPEAAKVFEELHRRRPRDLEIGLQLADVWTHANEHTNALELIDDLRTLPAPLGEDARLDLAEARAAAFADFERADLALNRAMQKGSEQHAPLVVARAQLQKATMLQRRREPSSAFTMAERAKDTFVEAGDAFGMGDALLLGATLLNGMGRHEEALERGREAAGILREIGHQVGRAKALNQLAISKHYLELEAEPAQQAFEEVLEIYQRVGNRRGVADTHNNLGLVFSTRERWQEALDHYRAAMVEQRAIDHRMGLARTLSNLSLVLQNQYEMPRARQALEESLALRRDMEDHRGAALTLLNMGHLERLVGHLEDAKVYYQESLQLARELAWHPGRARALQGLGWVAYLGRDLDEARRLHEEALLHHAHTDAPSSPAYARIILAKIWLEQGEPQRAEATLPEIPKGGAAGWTHIVLARALGFQGRIEEATHHIDQARALRDEDVGFADPAVGIELIMTEMDLGFTDASSVADHRAYLEATLQNARAGGLVNVECQTRLALAQLETFPLSARSSEPPDTNQRTRRQDHLQTVIGVCEARGLLLYVRQAREAVTR